MMKTVNKLLIGSLIICAVFAFVPFEAAAQNKVVVIPLFSDGATSSTSPAPVAKTGQSDTYATGDDGDLEKGVVWPTPRFTDNSDGTVTDNLTGLIWLKNANCPNAARSWADAFSDVSQLNTDGTMNSIDCGDTSNSGSHQTDWRLPNVKELLSLIDFGEYAPALISGHPFLDPETIVNNYYWSSTTSSKPGASNFAWATTLISGDLLRDNKLVILDPPNPDNPPGEYYVWAVRGGE